MSSSYSIGAALPQRFLLQSPTEKMSAGMAHRTSTEDLRAAEERMERSLATYVSDLKPFLSEKVVARLQSLNGNKSTEKFVSIDEVQQPKSITGAQLRDYQIKGVGFLHLS